MPLCCSVVTRQDGIPPRRSIPFHSIPFYPTPSHSITIVPSCHSFHLYLIPRPKMEWNGMDCGRHELVQHVWRVDRSSQQQHTCSTGQQKLSQAKERTGHTDHTSELSRTAPLWMYLNHSMHSAADAQRCRAYNKEARRMVDHPSSHASISRRRLSAIGLYFVERRVSHHMTTSLCAISNQAGEHLVGQRWLDDGVLCSINEASTDRESNREQSATLLNSLSAASALRPLANTPHRSMTMATDERQRVNLVWRVRRSLLRD